ncbi:xanthine dehydrogenase/oxidase-like [Acanthaster planci]|uniref:Xanthine dehydrogenase/oxidase-like n=1 Tax=Acanthaster planci TaxID=133434 RepID=A0A8B7XYD5_ACAPL|nr:xanthine dehydrogenase/oxidase-like [Acanthaster planci]
MRRKYGVAKNVWETVKAGKTESKRAASNQPCLILRFQRVVSTELFDPSEFTPYDSTQEPIFPPELMLMLDEGHPAIQTFSSDNLTWLRPATLRQLLNLKVKHPEAKMVVGNTEIGVEVKFKNWVYPLIIDVNHIPELIRIDTTPAGVRVGASVSLTSLDLYLKQIIHAQPECKTRVFAAIVEMLRWFAGHQIRNVACLGGNIATGSPISDLNPLLMAARCKLELTSKQGSHTVTMDGNFFTGYRRNVIATSEVIVAVNIPFTSEDEYFYGYKQALRREDDIAIVNAGMRVLMKPGTNVVQDCTLAFGGMAPTSVLASKAMTGISGRTWSNGLVEAMCPLLAEDLPLPPGAPGGMEPYRQSLALSFFFKFYLAVLEQLKLKLPGLSGTFIPDSYKTANQQYRKNSARGVQMYQDSVALCVHMVVLPQRALRLHYRWLRVGLRRVKLEVPSGQPDSDAVGRPLTHMAALKQVTGEALYADDITPAKGDLYLGLVCSKVAHAKLLSIDASAALAVKGVHAFVDINDVPGSNIVGVRLEQDDPLFADGEVLHVGQLIGFVVADNQTIAKKAAQLVKVEYQELLTILTIEEAIQHGSYLPFNLCFKKGNVQEGFESSDHMFEGEMRLGAQEHFYLETFTTLVIPGEGGEVEVISSTQALTTTQVMVAKALGVPNNKVVTRVKRLGGGFGGKESRCCVQAAACAVAANKVSRPVRLMLDRDEDMNMTGTRHPFLGRYKVGLASDGQVRALQIDLYSNCGFSYDLSSAVMENAAYHADNCYNIPNFQVEGHLCKTNLPSNTAFRGFGCPQVMLIMESIMSEIAGRYGLSELKLRERHFYTEGDENFLGQELKNWNLGRCWKKCLTKSDYEKRRRDVDQFNNENRWRKRGIAATPTKFGISFAFTTLNQAGALVHIYTDGTVLISHSGVEMGQGLHTKMIQVASRALRIPQEKIHIMDTDSSKVPNTSPTAASVGSDLNGMAIKTACETVLHNLEPFMRDNPKGTWEDWVKAAYLNRVSLSTTGFYSGPDLKFDRQTGRGKRFSYFCCGTAVSEVEIDCLTGDHQVLRTDIVMDVGDSINPAIDIGQIEGAFVQGYGMFVLEDYRVTPTGHLLTKGPGFYKIPACGDIPAEFNVSLLTRAPNPFNVCSSKAIGEPPFFLAASVFFAIKDAIQSARNDAGIRGPFKLDSPATAERIRMACQDQFTKQFPTPEPGTYIPFFVRP